MPGVFDASNDAEKTAEESNVGTSEQNDSSVDRNNDDTPTELNQIDKINKFLLKTFLERINNHPMNMQSDDLAENNADSENDWN